MRWALVLAPLLLGGCCFTEVGCDSGIFVSGIDAPFDEIEVCVNGECGEPFSPDGSAMVGDSFIAPFGAHVEPNTLAVRPFAVDALQSGDQLELRLLTAGERTAEREFVVDDYHVLRPNGELCEPVCLSAIVTW